MIILGIDPGVAIVGYGAIEYQSMRIQHIRHGVIRTPAHTPLSQRLMEISDDMKELLQLFSPDAVSVEELFFSKNVTTGIAVSHARGVILLECRRAGVPIYEYTPMQVKQAVTGYGGAEKRQVMDMTQRLLELERMPRPDDAADALAMAICHAHYNGGRTSLEATI